MNIALIGAGNLASNLGHALKNVGHNIVIVYSRTIASANSLANAIGCCGTDRLDDVKSVEADVYIISVKDSALKQVIDNLCELSSDKVFMHTAGSMPMNLFLSKAQHYGVLYPMQTFSKDRLLDFSCIPFFIEANSSYAMERIRTLAESVSNNVRELTSESRKSLHLAAVFACNFTNHCYALSAEVLKRNDLPFDVMLPLINETASKVNKMHPVKAQTGPAVRYDKNVIDKQLKLLEYNQLAHNIYKYMSMSIHEKQKDNDKL